MARISFLFLILLLIGVSCKNGQDHVVLEEPYMQDGILDGEEEMKINLSSINKIFGEATTDFYVENHYAFRNEDTINTILDSVGLVFYRDIFNDLLYDVYVRMGCSWADIQIKQNGEVFNIRYGDESEKSIIGCEIKYTAHDILEFSENQTIIYDCHNNKGKMSFEKSHSLSNNIEISLNLFFVTAG